MDTSPEFLNSYLEVIFEDIAGKNKELILLKTNVKMLADKIAELTSEISSKEDEMKELSLKLANVEETSNEDIRRLKEKLARVEGMERDFSTLENNYRLVTGENNSLKAQITQANLEIENLKKASDSDWILGEIKSPRRKSKKVKNSGEQVSA